jgi:hypothetical protein
VLEDWETRKDTVQVAVETAAVDETAPFDAVPR